MLNIFSLGGARKKPKREGKSRNKNTNTNTHTQNPDQTSPPSSLCMLKNVVNDQIIHVLLNYMINLTKTKG